MKLVLTAAVLFLVGCSPQRQTDNIALPFVNDPEAIGKWESVDFVKSPEEFKAGVKSWHSELTLTDLVFNADGKTSKPWWTWTKGVLIHTGDKTAAQYSIRAEEDASYMFVEWKSGDYTIRKMKPWYYVLKKMKG